MPEARSYVEPDGTCPFEMRLEAIKDARAAVRIAETVNKLERGLRPDVEPVGEGVFEAKIDYGPGYRVYFALDGIELIILLLCGDKRTQPKDIKAARKLWKDYKA